MLCVQCSKVGPSMPWFKVFPLLEEMEDKYVLLTIW